MPVRRRTVLAAVGTAIATTGCLGASTPASDPGDGPSGTPTTDPTGTPSPTPGDDGRFPDEPCPSFSDTDRTVCSHTRSGDEPVYLAVPPGAFQPVEDTDEVETYPFTLHNESDQSVGFNPYGWVLKARTPSGWRHVAPEVTPEPWTTVEPGGTYTWVLRRQEHPTANDDGTTYLTVDLQSGLHAFAVTGLLDGEDDGTEDGSGEESTADPTSLELIGLFDVAVGGQN